MTKAKAKRKGETALPTKEKFFSALMVALIEARKRDPEAYGERDHGSVDLMTVYQRYVTNLSDGSFSRFSPLLRSLCEGLGVKLERETIKEILSRKTESVSPEGNETKGEENETR